MRELKKRETITSREERSTMAVLKDISKFSVPTAEEEKSLALRIKNGDRAALNELIERNIRFVVSVAKQYQGYGMSLGDLISEGTFGLIKAAERFDVKFGFRFCSYAVWWIRQSIQKAIGENGNSIRIPISQRVNLSLINKVQNAFELQHGREATKEELSGLMDIDIESIGKMINLPKCGISLDATVGEDDGCTFEELIAGEERTDSYLEERSVKTDVKRVLATLPERHREVLELSYGLNGKNECSLEEIADKMSLSRERTRQIKEEALRVIRKSHAAMELLDNKAA